MRISDWSSDVCSSDLIMKDHGATRINEAWQDDVPKGKQTDFIRATKAESGEAVVFSFVEWSSRDASDGSQEEMMKDARQNQIKEENPAMKPPVDGKRRAYDSYNHIVNLSRQTHGDQ